MRKLLAIGVALLCSMLVQIESLRACPFCAAVQQTLRQEMASMDAVVLTKYLGGGENETDAEFEIIEAIKGGELAKVGQIVRAAYFGTATKGATFLIMGVDPPELLWSSPLPVNATATDYVKAIHKLPDSPQKQLEFYINYLENAETLLARDAYDEFGQAPYTDVKLLKDKMNHDQIVAWIQDVNLSADRKRLYLVMLGICGKPDDAQLIEKLLKSEDPNQRAGLDAMIACYVTLRGADGLPLIEELFLKNKKSQYADTYSAIMALRFHGTEGGVVEKKRVVESLHLILQRPELADLVIPDLARWEDWTQIDRLVELFKNADDKTSWVRVPVINYLRACPLPVAAEKLAELQELDPAAYKRANAFFPVPQPTAPATPSSKQSSSNLTPKSAENIAIRNGQGEASPAQLGLLGNGNVLAGNVLAARSTQAVNESALDREYSVVESNPGLVASVFLMATSTVGLALWLAISGAGNSSIVSTALGLSSSR